jgi:4-oxalocrotonate tautomerase
MKMPHVIVKLYPGRSEEQKQRLADAIAKDVQEIVVCPAGVISVAIEEVPAAEWQEKVYEPDILAKPQMLYKKPAVK